MKLFFIPICVVIAVAVAIVSCDPPKTIQVPLSSCQSTPTGRQKEVEDIYYTCVSYDKNMNCTVQMPNFTSHTEREIRTVCNFSEWR